MFVLREGLHDVLVLHQGSSQATHNTGNLKQDVLFKKLGFEEIEVSQRGVVEGFISRRDHRLDLERV